ncbi:hypothetical protein D9M68_883570 [compost metagenome]
MFPHVHDLFLLHLTGRGLDVEAAGKAHHPGGCSLFLRALQLDSRQTGQIQNTRDKIITDPFDDEVDTPTQFFSRLHSHLHSKVRIPHRQTNSRYVGLELLPAYFWQVLRKPKDQIDRPRRIVGNPERVIRRESVTA